ncbi:MAG: T9SS type A sorting domain-containing protein [Flavobacteriaceae bacterium]|nr:T9SS type A sorting domain-containing protein [Flavobacteriaceae bacterium]
MIKKLLFIIIFCTTSVVFSQEKTIEKLSAAPNPFTHNTKITFNTQKSSKIYFTVKNILGKTVHKESIKTKFGKNSIPFSKGNLSTGIYIYSIQNENKIVSKRFVIK